LLRKALTKFLLLGILLTVKFNLKSRIIFENDFYLVVNKPAGLLVHSTKYQLTETLVDYLKKYYPKIKEIGQTDRPGIVHRLDRDVSGLMVIAKTNEMYESLVFQFKERQVKKNILAWYMAAQLKKKE